MIEPPYRFEFLDHTADIAVVAHGNDLLETFASAARAMFEVMADLGDVRPRLAREIEITGDSVETLLVDWLNELLFLFETEHILLSSFLVHNLQHNSLRATVRGESVDPTRHHLRTGVKAVTYHMLEVKCEERGCEARVVFDV
jgi:SHS2 domain-containing protein